MLVVFLLAKNMTPWLIEDVKYLAFASNDLQKLHL